jgi:RNA polymerase sigma-70 factor, ECF subfamily
MQAAAATMKKGHDADLGPGDPSSPEIMRVLSRGLPSLYRCAYKLLGNKADAEDAVQDALLAAYKHLNEFRGEARISTWVMTILLNCARMQLRKRSRIKHVSLDLRIGQDQKYSLSEILVDERPNPEDECHNSKLRAQLMKSVEQLSPPLQRTFHLRYVDHLSLCETAEVLGVPIGTVKAQIARARAKLWKSMGGVLDGHLGRVHTAANKARPISSFKSPGSDCDRTLKRCCMFDSRRDHVA